MEHFLEHFRYIDLNQEFDGKAIKKKRDEEDLSARQLAEQLQVSKANLYKWEKGHKPSDPEDFIKITNWLNKKVESVPRGTKEIEKPQETLNNAHGGHIPDWQIKYIEALERLSSRSEMPKEAIDYLTEIDRKLSSFLSHQKTDMEKLKQQIGTLSQNLQLYREELGNILAEKQRTGKK